MSGPAPVPLADYVLSVEAQAAGLDPIDRDQLARALATISHEEELLDQLGPAINSNTGLFLFGPPGNGKTTIARSLTACLGQEIWIPHAILDDGNLIKLQDDAFHRPAPVPETDGNIPQRPGMGSPLVAHPTTNRRRWRRAGHGQLGSPPRPPLQHVRSPIANEEATAGVC